MVTKEDKMFFSVKTPIKIGGKPFHTCICYELKEELKSAVEKLASKGKAEIYNEVKFFCNGKLVEKKPVVKENLTTEKKEKKSKKAQKKEPKIAEIEESPIAEEVTDESEGF